MAHTVLGRDSGVVIQRDWSIHLEVSGRSLKEFEMVPRKDG